MTVATKKKSAKKAAPKKPATKKKVLSIAEKRAAIKKERGGKQVHVEAMSVEEAVKHYAAKALMSKDISVKIGGKKADENLLKMQVLKVLQAGPAEGMQKPAIRSAMLKVFSIKSVSNIGRSSKRLAKQELIAYGTPSTVSPDGGFEGSGFVSKVLPAGRKVNTSGV